MDSETIIIGFVVAALLGATVGLQREVVKSDVAAGARTFAMYGMWGAVGGYLGQTYGGAGLATAVVGFAALVTAAYVVGVSRGSGRGTTAEAAAFVVFGVGVLAMDEQYTAAAAVAVGTAALLESKRSVKLLSERLEDVDVRVALQFAIVTALVLPLVPDTGLGPQQALNLREVWLMVVLVSGIGLIGYASLRLVGSRGLGVAGLVGGLVSSTAVTLGFSRMSTRLERAFPPIAAGIIGASALMYGRVMLETGLLAPTLMRRLAPLMIALLVALAALAAWWFVKPVVASADEARLGLQNPLSLSAALQFGAIYAAIVVAAAWLRAEASDGSLVLVGAAAGVADVDAITLSMANLVRDGADVGPAARAVATAVGVNTLVKAGMVVLLGSPRLRRVVGGPLVAAGIVALAAVLVI